MTNFYKIFIILSLSLSLYFLKKTFFSTSTLKKTTTLNFEEQAFNLNEDFFMSRNYPDFNLQTEAYKSAMQQAKTMALQKDVNNWAGFDANWRLEGPGNIGGRINAVVAHPNNGDIIYAGCSRGGVFKTVNGGLNWQPIFDDQLFNSISCIVFEPNNANTVFVGTGDLNISQSFSTGNGIYKSTNSGTTWTNIGLSDAQIISNIAINPNNTNIIYASAMGNPAVPDANRGVYKTNNGGTTWEKVLFINDSTGVIDLVMNPENPNILYAATWKRIRNMQTTTTTSTGVKIYKTSNGGTTWEPLVNGLPDYASSRVGLAISKQNPNKLFALYVSANENVDNIYKTIDGGTSWQPTISNSDSVLVKALGNFGWYFGKIYLNPANDDEIYLLGVDLWRSYDSGNSWALASPEWWSYEVHADKHALHFVNTATLLLATDGGLYKSENDGDTWEDIEDIPNTQFYRVAINCNNPNMYYGGAQDNGTICGNSDDVNNWTRKWGGDGFQARFKYNVANLNFYETQFGNIAMVDDSGNYLNIGDSGIDPNDRVNWDMPYIISSHNPDIMYTGTYRMYKATFNGIPNWEPLSEDLTDGNIYGDRFHNITTIDESPINANILYVGSSDGNVNSTIDGGNTWQNVSNGLPKRYITCIKASPFYENTVYATVSGYKGNGFEPHVFVSKNNGNIWKDISNNLPPTAANDIAIMKGKQDSLLFVATDDGVYASLNSGVNWERLGTGLTYSSVFDIEIDTFKNRLVAGTFARSMYSFPIDSILNKQQVSISPTPPPTAISVMLHPNPTSNTVFISASENIQQVNLYDVNGKAIASKPANEKQTALSVSLLANGLYYIEIKTINYKTVKKLIKQ